MTAAMGLGGHERVGFENNSFEQMVSWRATTPSWSPTLRTSPGAVAGGWRESTRPGVSMARARTEGADSSQDK